MERIKRISSELAISPRTVAQYLAYQLVPNEVQQLITDGKLSREVAYKITEAFWPDTNKITRIAKYATRMTKLEWQRALDLGRKKPKASAEEIFEEAKKVPTVREIVIVVDTDVYSDLQEIAKKRKMEVVDLIRTQIDRLLDEEEPK